MEIRQLRYFVRIADLGSLSKAARVLHVAQPALSKQLAQLEAELGHALLHRRSVGVQMTEQGEVFYAHAQRVLQQLDGIPAAVNARVASPSGTVTVGLPQSTAALYALPLLAEAGRNFPGITLALFDELSGHIPQRVASGRFDMAVLVNDDESALLSATPLLDEQLYLVSRPWQAPAAAMVGAAELGQLALLLPGPGQGVRPVVDAFMAQAGVPLCEPAVQINSMDIMRRAMLAGLGHCVMPWGALADELAAGVLVATPIAPRLTRRVTLCTAPGSELSLAAQAIHDLLLRIVRQAVAEGLWIGVTAIPG